MGATWIWHLYLGSRGTQWDVTYHFKLRFQT